MSRLTPFLVGLAALLGACESARPARPSAGEFLPSRHGFRFVNHFEGSPLPASLRDPSSPLGAILTGQRGIPATFGLCGGMSLTAADHFLAGAPMPLEVEPPAQGTPLFEHLYRRQTESLGEAGVMVVAFWTWMSLPDVTPEGDCAASLTAKELPSILERLNRGDLVPLGLVLVRSRTNTAATQSRIGQLWNNHQVVAYGVSNAGRTIDVRIYDPNYPGDDGVILRFSRMADREDAWAVRRITGTGRTTRVRGVFPMPYAAMEPFRPVDPR